jgi:hypothetical protein
MSCALLWVAGHTMASADKTDRESLEMPTRVQIMKNALSSLGVSERKQKPGQAARPASAWVCRDHYPSMLPQE